MDGRHPYNVYYHVECVEQSQLLRGAAREGREYSTVFNTSAWARYLETGARMALQIGERYILVPARAVPPFP
jgi:hypothetical protein